MKIGFVGLGNMGTTMANLVALNGHNVIGWEHDRQVVEEINTTRFNTKYLKGVPLDARLSATARLEEVFANTGIIFVALPSGFIRSSLAPYAHNAGKGAIVVNLAKGIEAETGITSSQTLSALFPGTPLVMLSGPAIANEIARRMPSAVIIAGRDAAVLGRVAKVLDNDYFKTSRSDDMIGVELGGILKNIYAIGLGIFDGKKIKSINFRAVYLTLALQEMKDIGVALGARPETFFFLAGLGDLFATSLSEHSHNRRLGELLAQDMPLEEIRSTMGVLPEGYNTLQAVLGLAERHRIDVPVARDLNDVINGKMKTERFIGSVIKEERIYYESHSGN